MSNSKVFPDQIHIEQIRKRLWHGREFGQAAVMVGAGFSRNAERLSTSTPVFPLWRELAERVYDSLYPPETLQEQEREKAISGLGVLKLASEYEAVFGRQALDNLILESIPDTNYLPGQLHELLLSLPWSDVFTTNYDTLLERTRPAIHDRKYDLILTASDIPGWMKPRIVKLHGSFPSHRPFIITEEDYRTYPTKFAPFVNMVQQAIMENVFCLIGFSGSDPNFLYWSGWVRDNLGPTAPPIYLCGLLNISSSQRKLLESRNVIPIDLSPLFPVRDRPEEICHARALEWLLLNLMYGAPPNTMTWPIPSDGSIWKPGDERIPIPPGPLPLSDPGKLSPGLGHLQTDDLRELCETWRQKRLEYPGWVVAPNENGEALWRYTKNWIEPVLESIEELPPPENLFLLYELNWRLETTLTPLFMNWVEKIIPVLETFNPYPGLVEIENATIRPDKEEHQQLGWKSIGECWVELIFALAREAREDQDEKRFRLWMDRLEKVVKQRAKWQARWFYEECLYYLFRFDQEKIRTTLENWPVTYGLPFWEIKRASILAELGDLKEAERIAEEALAEIRFRLQPYSKDYSLLSQEGWAMVLLKGIKDNEWGAEKDFVGQYQDRWEKLGTYRCNPWPEIERMRLVLEGPLPDTIAETGFQKTFDPGRMTVTYRWPSGLGVSNVRPAFAFLRMFEEGGLPMRCGSVNMFSDTVMNSAKWIAPFAPLWSLSSMIRAGNYKEVEEWFGRVRIAILTPEEVDQLYRLFMNSLTQSIQYLAENSQQIGLPGMSFSERQVRLLSESLSRLCFRFSSTQFAQLFELATDMYKMPLFRQYHFLHSCVDVLFRRLLYAMPQLEILQRIPELLSLPIPTEMGFEVSEPQRWPKPFDYTKWLEDTELDPDFERSAWTAPIANLLRVVEHGTPDARKRAAVRLGKLYEIKGLTAEESDAFGKALWSRLDPQKGLPSDTEFLDFGFLHFPETEEGIAKENFRRYVLSADFPRVVRHSITPDGKRSKSVGIGPQDNRLIREWLGGTVPLFTRNEEVAQRFVDWTADEATELLRKAAAWWDDEKAELQEGSIAGFPGIAGTLRQQFAGLVPLMSRIILPRLADVEDETKDLARRLLSEMEQSGFCVLSALPMTLFIDSNSDDEIAQKLRVGLNSMKQEEVHGSMIGLSNWLMHGTKQTIPVPPSDLLNELVNRVVSRRQPGLNSAIQQLSFIVRRLPELLNENQMESVCVALEYLVQETELPSGQDPGITSNLSTVVPINDRPEYRKLAVGLAHRLFVHFTNSNKEVPQILIKWKEIGQSDPLPEVRRAWP